MEFQPWRCEGSGFPGIWQSSIFFVINFGCDVLLEIGITILYQIQDEDMISESNHGGSSSTLSSLEMQGKQSECQLGVMVYQWIWCFVVGNRPFIIIFIYFNFFLIFFNFFMFTNDLEFHRKIMIWCRISCLLIYSLSLQWILQSTSFWHNLLVTLTSIFHCWFIYRKSA